MRRTRRQIPNITDGLFAATDPENDTLTYSLGGTDAAHFEIDSNGQVKTKGMLNHEGKETYSIIVQVSDGRSDAGTAETPPVVDDTHAVSITVTDVAEAPEFDGPNPFTLTVPEDTGNGEEIGDPFTATDEDENSTLTYTLGGTDSSSFTIDEDTGQLSTNTELDFENNPTNTVTITVSDGDPTTADDTITVNIKVQDQNDPPEFDGATTTREVAEDTAAGGSVGAPVEAIDDDNDTLTYSLSGADAAKFDIDESTGQIQVKEPLDYETKRSYSVTLSVTDGLNATGTTDTSVDDTIEVAISVTNVDEDGVVTLSTEYPGLGTPVTAALADPDGTPTGVTWQWANSTDNSTWIDITTNGTAETYTPVSADEDKFLRATASYTDPVIHRF